MSIAEALRARIREQAGDQCGYCRSPQRYVLGILEIDHIIPVARGGSDGEDNLWLACRLCNGFKGTQTHAVDPLTGRRVRLFNPRRQLWTRHFQWSADGTEVQGRTSTGRATVNALQFNNVIARLVRGAWTAAGWHPPKA